MGREKIRQVAVVLMIAAAARCVAGAEGLRDLSGERRLLAELTEESTLADYLAYAALNNPELEAAFNRWKAALERVPQAKSLPDPRFSYRYFIREVETRVGPQRQGFELSQMFPWFGKLDLAGDVAMQAALAAQQGYETVKLRLFFEVKDAYYEYYYLEQSIAVTYENAELLKYLEGVARIRYTAAAGSHPDVIRAQVEVGKLEDQLNSLRDLRGPIVARLNAVLNRPVEAELPSPKPFSPSPVAVDDGELLDALDRLNPQLKALGHEVERYRKATELAKKQYSPDIKVGVSYVDVAHSDMAAGFADNGKDAVGAMVSVNIPIWHKKYSAAVREARMRRLAAVREKTDIANKLKSALKMALYRFRDAQRKLDLYSDALIPKAEESLKVTEQSFRAGNGSFLDLIDAQRTYLEFALAHERALTDHEQGIARIEMLVGGSITTARNETGPANVGDSGPEEAR